MASEYSYPNGNGQDGQTTSVPTIATSSYFAPISVYPTPQDSQPPSPSDISAAAILATLSESRPPTSHAEDADGLIDDDDFGGISLPDEGDHHHTPGLPAALGQWITDQGTNVSLDQHAAALEALSMEQLPTPPPPPAIHTQDSPALAPPPPAMSGHQNWAPSTSDGHLSIQDPLAFIDIASYFQYYAQLPKGGVYPSLELAAQPAAITREQLPRERLEREKRENVHGGQCVTLDGEKCDFQGIDWGERTSRPYIRSARAAFERRRLEHKVFEGHGLSHRHQLRNKDDFFSFRRMNTTHRAYCPHFQLRNLMTATSRNDVFYATEDALLRTDAFGSPAVPIIDLNKQKVNGNKSQITTLAAQDNVLIAGGFEGDYMIADLNSSLDTRVHFGLISDWAPDAKSYIANHVHLFNPRTSYTPQAVLCSNDSRLRVLDCLTDTIKHNFAYPSAVNCSATSPDGRMRVVVGDFRETFVTNAETGQPFEILSAHVDDAFACAWADDGIHIATAAQDSTIVVWDARYWRKPLAVMPSELSIPRVLKFSPVGGGPKVLVAAEADDYVNIINAQTWDSKQIFDFFGPAAGISMTPDGQSLFIANTEQRFGGIIELERTGSGGSRWREEAFSDDECGDWASDGEMEIDRRVPTSRIERERRGIDLGSLVV